MEGCRLGVGRAVEGVRESGGNGEGRLSARGKRLFFL